VRQAVTSMNHLNDPNRFDSHSADIDRFVVDTLELLFQLFLFICEIL
jgi:hypothetical protein